MGLREQFAALTEELNGTAGALGQLPPVLDQIADKQKKVADAAAALNMALSIQRDEVAKANEVLKDTAAAATVAADAFGRVANGLTEVNAAADNATAGLEGVAWEMRKATPATVSLTDAQKALIESLAKVSDAGGASSLWVGHLIAQLEKGEISFGDFTSKVNQLLQELTKMGPVMGNTAGELNAINTLLDKFRNSAGGGWPTPGGGH